MTLTLYIIAGLALAVAVASTVWLELASRKRRAALRRELDAALEYARPDAVESRALRDYHASRTLHSGVESTAGVQGIVKST